MNVLQHPRAAITRYDVRRPKANYFHPHLARWTSRRRAIAICKMKDKDDSKGELLLIVALLVMAVLAVLKFLHR
jgi:hypothetical protein